MFFGLQILNFSSTHLCLQLSQKILETSNASVRESVKSNPGLVTDNPAPAETESAPNEDSIPENGSTCEAGYFTTDKPVISGAPDIINVMSYQTDVGAKSVHFSTTNVEHDPVKSPRHVHDKRTAEEKRADRKALEEKTAAFGVKVQNNLNDSLHILEKEFVHGFGSSNGSDSIRDIGNHILENDIKESRKTSQGSMKASSSYLFNHAAPTDKQLHAEIIRLEEVVDESKVSDLIFLI